MIEDKELNIFINNQAKEYIKYGLEVLGENHTRFFKMMYGRNNGKRSMDDTLNMSIDDVISEIPNKSLKWAVTQVENSLKKIK